MRKNKWRHNINRNFNHFLMNSVSPEVVMDHEWEFNESPDWNFQIIDLDSIKGVSIMDESNYENCNEICNYNRFQNLQNMREINNSIARNHRRLEIKLQNDCSKQKGNNHCADGKRNGFEPDNKFVSGYFPGCVDIVDRHFDMDWNSSSSRDTSTNIEVINCNNKFFDEHRYTDKYDDDIINFDDEASTEKRTVWIYSLKNRFYTSENSREDDSFSSKDSLSSTSTDSINQYHSKIEHKKKTKRIATPTPTTYLPMFNLNSTLLPTVTKIRETNSKEITPIFDNGFNKQKNTFINSWIENEKPSCSENFLMPISEHKNVITWSALSPRQRRRNYKGASSNQILPTLNEVSSYIEEKQCDNIEGTAKLLKNAKIANDVDEFKLKTDFKNDNKLKNEKCTNNCIASEDDCNKICFFRKPRIQVERKEFHSVISISEPIENLESRKWISEDASVKQNTNVNDNYATRLNEANLNIAGDELLIRNMSLLKPSDWNAYLPITESPPSIQISLDSISEETKAKCLWKIFRCFRCCK